MDQMDHFCTYFNRNYLLRGLALYRSLKEHHVHPFTFWVLCFDEYTYQTLTALKQPNIRPIALQDFERGDTALLQAKQNRSTVEYYFTCSPSWPLYLFHHFPEIDAVTYLDADLFFFSELTPIYDALGSQSILIVAHRFPDYLKHLEMHGVYNVGYLTFRNDEFGQACLHQWREQCLEWCYDRPENGRFADQKYLDEWPNHFKQVVELQHKGANLAPWNWMNYTITAGHEGIFVDEQPLIFYHFQGLKIFRMWMYDPNLYAYGYMPSHVRNLLYKPYLKAIQDTLRWAAKLGGTLDPGYSAINSRTYGWRQLVKGLLYRQVGFNMH